MEPDEDVFAVKLEPSTMDMSGIQNNDHSTPSKRTKQAMKPDPDSTDEDIQQTPSKKPKQSPGERGGVLGPIPANYEKASHEDKMIMQMREDEGKSWAEIRKVLEGLTKAKIGASSLQIRYSRMKANFVVIEKDDESALLLAKKEVEDKMEQEKWQKVADVLEAKTGNKYPSSAVLKKFKELSKRGGGGGGGGGGESFVSQADK